MRLCLKGKIIACSRSKEIKQRFTWEAIGKVTYALPRLRLNQLYTAAKQKYVAKCSQTFLLTYTGKDQMISTEIVALFSILICSRDFSYILLHFGFSAKMYYKLKTALFWCNQRLFLFKNILKIFPFLTTTTTITYL